MGQEIELGTKRIAALICAAILLAMAVSMCAAVPTPAFAEEPPAAGTAGSDPNPEASAVNGWDAAHTHYYANGQPVSGAYEIEGVWRVFDKTGKLMTETCTLGSTTYYPNEEGVLRAREANGVWYYANGREMTAVDASDFKCLVYAEEVAKTIVSPSDDLETKRLKCFQYIMHKKYKNPDRPKNYAIDSDWPSVYAMDQLPPKKEYGDCISSACAFAYLAAAVGCPDVVLCTTATAMSANPGNHHSFVRIGDRYFDPQKARKFSTDEEGLAAFYNVENAAYENDGRNFVDVMKNGTGIAIPRYSMDHKVRGEGLTKRNGAYYYFVNDVPLRSTWKTVKGKRYYFKSNGKAAVKSCKIGKAYYVFNTKGQLMKGSKTRIVKIDGSYYRVTKSGKAYPGKVKGQKRYFTASGKQAKGLQQVGKYWYVFNSKGAPLVGKGTRTVKVGGVYYKVKKDGRVALGWNKAHTRYFLKNGQQAKGLRKIGSTYYVFGDTGYLKRGKSTRVVTVSGNRYLVSKTGKAKTGWSSSHKYLFAGHGTQVKGSCFYKGKLYYLSPTTGAYSSGNTSKLRSLAKADASGNDLIALLGKPTKTVSSESCIDHNGETGDDVVYTYPHLQVMTFKVTQKDAEDVGAEYVYSVIER